MRLFRLLSPPPPKLRPGAGRRSMLTLMLTLTLSIAACFVCICSLLVCGASAAADSIRPEASARHTPTATTTPKTSSSTTSAHKHQDAAQCNAIYDAKRRPAPAAAAGLLLLAEAPADGWLDAGSPIDVVLAQTLNLTGPDMKPANGFEDPRPISLDVSRRAWQLMHDHVLEAARQRIDFLWPAIEQVLTQANVSAQCLIASQRVATGAMRLESWAIQMLNAWGSFPPAGLFEGTYGDIGSFRGCINVPENAAIKHAHFCTIAYKPVLPTRPNYELIVRPEPEGLQQLFESKARNGTQRDALSDLIRKAQYNHFIYYKLGTCFPIDCSPVDVQAVARLLGRRLMLISGPVKCQSKFGQDYEQPVSQTGRRLQLSSRDLNDGVYIWKPHVTRAQLVALVIVCSLFGIILAATFIDLICNYCLPLLSDLHATRVGRSNRNRKQPDHKPVNDDDDDDGAELEMATLNANDSEDPNNNTNLLSIVNHETNTNTKTPSLADKPISSVADHQRPRNATGKLQIKQQQDAFMQLISDCSLITSAKEFVSTTGEDKNSISCISGLRVVTMSWIIMAHTMQYNDWSAFARTHEIETHLKSLVNQPLFNASNLVDTFFLISGLLTSYSAFRTNIRSTLRAAHNVKYPKLEHILQKFSCKSYLIGRYLRLTPQIMLVSLLFILLPLSSTGSPHWYTMTGEYSENCSNNWWINLLHIQAFYKSSEMCNFVCWWISIDMFYHLFALFIILFILKYGTKISLKLYAVTTVGLAAWQATLHYKMGLPPNLLSTIPQTGAMWSQMTLEYFWRPEAHAFPFLFGFYLGYLMSTYKTKFSKWFTLRRALVGWTLAISCLFAVSYGTYFWVIGTRSYTSQTATLFNVSSQIVWSLCLAWIIVACHFGHGSFVQRLLSCKLFVVLGRASYIVYLSHFLVLFSFFGAQNLLMEPTQVLMAYVVLGNVCLSMLFGSLLCVTFELPWLKIQRRIMRLLR